MANPKGNRDTEHSSERTIKGAALASPEGTKEADRASELGALLRILRRDHGWTLAELASKVPMSASNLSRLELGEQGPPSAEAIESIAKALAVDPNPLLLAAGRVPRGKDFEQVVLERLTEIQSSLNSLRRSIDPEA